MIAGLVVGAVARMDSIRDTGANAALIGLSVILLGLGLYKTWKSKGSSGSAGA